MDLDNCTTSMPCMTSCAEYRGVNVLANIMGTVFKSKGPDAGKGGLQEGVQPGWAGAVLNHCCRTISSYGIYKGLPRDGGQTPGIRDVQSPETCKPFQWDDLCLSWSRPREFI